MPPPWATRRHPPLPARAAPAVRRPLPDERGRRCLDSIFLNLSLIHISLFGWIRTELEQPLPDGSATLAFHQAALERMNPERDVWTLPGWNFSTRQGEIRTLLGQYRALGKAGLWNNLRYFLQAVAPEAERLGIRCLLYTSLWLVP